jgi:hypothetical protein
MASLGKQRGIRGIIEYRLFPRFFGRRYFRSGLHTGAPLNGQIKRQQAFRAIIAQCAVEQIVETGTYAGASTGWFGEFGVPVATVELAPLLYHFSAERLRDRANIVIENGDSVAFLSALARSPAAAAKRTLFYLDAHWRRHLPLADELRVVFGNFAEAVVAIDDFLVPDDAGYGFDDYGTGRRLDLDYISRAGIGAVNVYFPASPSSEETGARRGTVYLAKPSSVVAARLAGVPEIRRYPA